jgi:type IV pilus assembly protein PilO
VSQLSRIVTLNDIALSTEKDGSIALDATAKTYRYLDEAELSAQRRKDGRKTSGERS